MRILKFIIPLLFILLGTVQGQSWTSFPKGDQRFLAEYEAKWVLLDVTPQGTEALKQSLLHLMPDNVIQVIKIESNRAIVQVKRTTDWSNVTRRLKKQGLANDYWLSLRRGTGIAFYDEKLIVKSTHTLPARTLKSMGVRCEKAAFIPNIFSCRTDEEDVLSVIRRVHELSEVEWAEPNFLKLYELFEMPKDPLLNEQWHLNNTENVAHISAFEAWQITTGSKQTVIAIVDSGTDLGHPEISPNLVGGFDALGNDDDPSPECGAQPDGQGPASSCPNNRPYRESHGTAVSGVAAGASNTVFGAGVCPDCGIYPVRLIGDSGGVRSLSSAQTFSRLTQSGVSVVNNSWGPSISQFFPLSQAEDETLTQLTTEGGNGLGAVVVFAAGNDYFQSADYNPYTSHPGVITVAASTRRDDFACYSNLGQTISIAAPSQGCFENENGLITADVRGSDGYSNEAVTRDFGGTSAASPVVAGVAGLILSAAPQLSAEAVRLIIEDTADKITTKTDWTPVVGRDLTEAMAYDKYGFSRFFGYGRINAGRAVTAAMALDGNPLFRSCDRDCAVCKNNICLASCEADTDCMSSQRCRTMENGQKACERPRRYPGDIGSYCGPECEVCATTYALDIRQVSICTAQCADDDACPSGFDCRRIDDGSQICVPGSPSCGEAWSDACQTRVQVGTGNDSVCSCDCIEGTTGACPESMVCSNAYCSFRRGSISCEPVDSQFQANEMPKCFPRTRSETTCSTHDDCSYGLFCIEGTCQVDQDGCDTCSECVRRSDCAEGSQCVGTQRGRRCLSPCSSQDMCDDGTHCVALPTVGQRYCINDDSDRKGVCPRSWRCPLGERCLLDSDCDSDCSCGEENQCDCPPEVLPDMSVPQDMSPLPTVNFPMATDGKATGCGCSTSSTSMSGLWACLVLLIFGVRRARQR